MMQPRNRRRKGGFTLIEVLLVLVILVVLASLAVVAYGPIQRRANINAAKSQIGLFGTPLQTYQMTVGHFPTTAQGLDALRNPPADLPIGLSGMVPTWAPRFRWILGAIPISTSRPGCTTRIASTYGPSAPMA